MSSRPAARVAFKVQGHDKTRLTIYRYGEDDRVPNPGDLLLVSSIGDSVSSVAELAILLPGRDMQLLAETVNEAALTYEANKEWLSAPVTKRGAA